MFKTICAQDDLRIKCKALKVRVTFDDYKRELCCAVSRGFSGCGKTTLFREFASICAKDPTCTNWGNGCNIRLGKCYNVFLSMFDMVKLIIICRHG